MRFLFIIFLAVLTACGGRFDLTAPAHLSGPQEGASPEYVQGWYDGCDSGRSTYANAFYKTFIKFRQDPVLAPNPVYRNAWEDAYYYCWQYQNTVHAHDWGNFQ